MAEAGRGLTRRRLLGLTGLAALGGGGGGLRYVERSNVLEVSRTQIPLPGVRRPFTVALIADVHAPGRWLDFEAVVAAANAARPEVVLIAGDAINEAGHEPLVEMYAPLEATHAKLSVVGNWENWARVDRRALAAHYARAGVAFLDNEVYELPRLGVRVVGLDERTNGWPDWSLLGAAPTDRPTLLMHHSPGAFDRLPLPAGAAALMVAGHTHGGQVAPFGRPILLPPGCGDYLQGLYGDGGGAERERAARWLYVTRGVGNSHFPVRVGAPPELALLRVVPG